MLKIWTYSFCLFKWNISSCILLNLHSEPTAALTSKADTENQIILTIS